MEEQELSDITRVRDNDNSTESSIDGELGAFSDAVGTGFSSLRYGVAEAIGRRRTMEDYHLTVPFIQLPAASSSSSLADELQPHRALFGVFDGHGGATAACFVSKHLLQYLLEEDQFPEEPGAALRSSFLRADEELYAEVKTGQIEDSGTTALAALVWGSTLVIANAGDSRAVLCRRGRAIELTQDHKPSLPAEQRRILAAGGTVCREGLLNGELSVSRAIGDYFSELKYRDSTGTLFEGPLTAEPEVATHIIMPEDEFVLLACDGLWDVFSSQRAVEFARGKLREHNDVAQCLGELVDAAMDLHTSDNVSVLMICFGDKAPPKREYSRMDGNGELGIVPRTLSRDGLSRLGTALGILSEPALRN